MGHVLYRMSFSSIIRESQDLGAGLFDTEFNTLCESESTPLHIGSLPGYLAGIATRSRTENGTRAMSSSTIIPTTARATRPTSRCGAGVTRAR